MGGDSQIDAGGDGHVLRQGKDVGELNCSVCLNDVRPLPDW